ncbi:MAG: hypothetical protein KBB24_09460 [Bacteroidales bacterium]|jgi:hypothetical protein|nr:hypothetical protein [Bacteroidales bacterium]MDX9925952.1 hypothetical protein [Bacteroidales bacterium]HNX84739.1 hypothetical protein [Bacteroidales bacterium]HOC47408.1 hypothetical protein [Bacteroidales bacterium]HPS96708.1 hypothetical protein [Bacteroidales bacterium]
MIGKLPVVLLAAVLLLTSCKKRNITDEGPTDVRIHNQTGQIINDVNVTVTDDPAYAVRTHNFGTVAAGAYSDYFRFDIAHTEADITVKIGNVTYSTPSSQFDYLTYIGPDRITYRITITDPVNRVLDIETVIEEPIDNL